MKCLCEDDVGMPCQREGTECPRCEVVCCWEHMDTHGCFPVEPHRGDTITNLQTLVERQAGVDMVPAVEHVSPRRPVTQEDWDRWLGL